MSITITIKDNIKYCKENNLGGTVLEACQCVEFPEIGEQCEVCNGSKVFSYVEYPYELNVTNQNFHSLWSSLGLVTCACGSTDARTIGAAMAKLDSSLVIREGSVDQDGGVTSFDCGLDESKLDRYLLVLRYIIGEAEQREELVVWY